MVAAFNDAAHNALPRQFAHLAASNDPLWDGYRAQMMRTSCIYMASEILSGDPNPPYYGRFLVGKHHLVWDELVCKHMRLCVESPRDSGKTFFFDYAYPIWQALRQPGGSGLICSGTEDMAVRILGDIKQEIESNPKLQWLYPLGAKKRWSTKNIELSNGHKIAARGFMTRFRGIHPRWLVGDDVIGDEAAYSETLRKKQINFFYSALSNVVVPGGQIIVVGTPFSHRDVYGELERNPAYVFRRFQALNAQDEPLWPVRYSKATLYAKRAEIGPLRFSREFQCVPISDDMSLFPMGLFQGEPTEQMTLTMGRPGSYWAELGMTVYIGVDFAISSNVGADYTVIFVVAVDAQGNRWVVDIQRHHGLPYQQQLSAINRAGHYYRAASIVCEANQCQRIFGDELIRTTDLPITTYTTGVEKHALDQGVPSLRILLENRKFRIPRGNAASIEATDIWVDEMHSFTVNEGKLVSVGDHDDTVMACWLAEQGIRMGTFSCSFGTEEEYQNVQDDPDDVGEPGEFDLFDAFGNPIQRAG